MASIIESVVNTALSIPFTFEDDFGALVTGKVNADFAKAGYLADTPATTASPTVAAVSGQSGDYAATVTLTTVGLWRVNVSCLHSDGVTYRFGWDVEVIYASAVSPISASGGLYASRAELKARIGATDTYSDDTYDAVLDAASRAIDGFTARRFYQDVGTIRYFTADDAYQLDIDDLVSVSELATDTTGDRTYVTTWDATDYDLEPYNAAATDWPYTLLCLAPRTTQYFPSDRRAIRITGTWGWPAIPGAVHEACLLLAARYAKRPSAPFGIDPNSADLGQPQQLASVDPDVKVLLAPYRKLTVGAV